ncbi:MAG: hypothetical protein QF682_09560 [Candidatus Thermoplasmatota archaeon]|jgi:hypothetical protein|nr:hypothetical protein [Candidatus Thermoplasmatota archaeon]
MAVGSPKPNRKTLNIDGIKILIIVATLVLSAIGILAVFSPLPAEPGTRTVHPPGKPSNPIPANDEKGITGNTISLSWTPTLQYRGDHKAITDNWLKISTQGPCNSDGATANVFNGALGPSTQYEISGSAVKMGTTYYWAVKCQDEDGWSPYSNWKFSTNALPVASITSITPSQAREGQEVLFVGEGADNIDNDDITAYKWDSNLNGELSSEKSFSSLDLKDPLIPGVHQITFQVQDSNELWSEVTSQCKRNLEITVNTPPSKPTALEVDGDSMSDDGELTTHKLSPRIKWRASTDPDPEDSVVYIISISAQLTYEKSIADEELVNVPEYSVPSVLSYGTLDSYSNIMSNTYYFEISASDGYKKSEKTKEEFKVINHPPDEPVIEIEPAAPTSSDSIFCHIGDETSSVDSDGDKVLYTYKWYKNDKFQDKLSGKGIDYADVDKKETNHFDTWKVVVTPTDGFIDGEDAEMEIVIGNEPPVARITNPYKIDGGPMYLDGAFYTIEEISFDGTGTTEPDNDPIVEYLWTSNISGQLGKGDSLKRKLEKPGQHLITLQVTDQQGAISNATVLIWVEEPPKPILTPVFKGDLAGPFKKGDRVGPITIMITNSGTDVANSLTISLTNNGVREATIPVHTGVSIARNMSYPVDIPEYLIRTDIVKLEVKINGNNSFGLPLSEARGELNYTKNSWSPIIKGSGANEETGSKGGIVDNWIWIILGFLVLFLVVAIIVFIVIRYRGKEEEYEDGPVQTSVGLEGQGPVEGYSIGPGGLPHPTAPPIPGAMAPPSMYMPPPFGPMPTGDRGPGRGMMFPPPHQLALPSGPEGVQPPRGMLPQRPFPALMPPMGMMPGIPGFQGGPPAPFSMHFPPPPYADVDPSRPPSHFASVEKPEIPEIFAEISPNEASRPASPACPNCEADVQEGWLMCPQCKKRLR